MKELMISKKMTDFFKHCQYFLDTEGHLHFLIKCLFLKFLVDHHQIDYDQNKKNIQKNFNLDYFIKQWQKKKTLQNNWESDEKNGFVLSEELWFWVNDFIKSKPSYEKENPMLLGELYETCIHLSHKKNQGIFYTPSNIAKLMVEKTVDWEKMEGKKKEIRILDPACGSGSLLIAVYDQMMAIYGKDKSDEEKKLLHKSLLENSLFGIDKDPLACLVIRLILVLKNNTYVYPKGIFCGDILIEAFIKKNSLDIIISNPPYVGHKEINSDYMKMLKQRYFEVYKDKGDLSYCFIKRGWELLKPEGRLVHITSRYFLEAYHGQCLRHFLTTHFEINEIIDFNGFRVISGVGVDPAIIFITKKEIKAKEHAVKIKHVYTTAINKKHSAYLIEVLRKKEEHSLWDSYWVEQKNLTDDLWRLYSPMTKEIITKIEKRMPLTLKDMVHSFQGIITGNDQAFIFENDDKELKDFNPEDLKPWIKNKDVQAYFIRLPQKKILYTNGIKNIKENKEVLKHLQGYKEKLFQRRECKNGKIPWYAIQWGRNPECFNSKKIIFPYKAMSNRFAIDNEQCFFSADVYGFILKPEFSFRVSEEFLVILLNSRLYNFYFKSFGKKLGNKLYEYYPNTLLKLGIPMIEIENNKIFKEFYDKIIKLLDNKKSLMDLLNEIDHWFYHYFELNEEQIKSIEKQQ